MLAAIIATLHILTPHLHLALVPFHGHGQTVLCQITTTHGQAYANGCATLPGK